MRGKQESIKKKSELPTILSALTENHHSHMEGFPMCVYHFVLETPASWLYSASPSQHLMCLPPRHPPPSIRLGFQISIRPSVLRSCSSCEPPSSGTFITTPAILSGPCLEQPPLTSQPQASLKAQHAHLLTPAALFPDFTEATGPFSSLLFT